MHADDWGPEIRTSGFVQPSSNPRPIACPPKQLPFCQLPGATSRFALGGESHSLGPVDATSVHFCLQYIWRSTKIQIAGLQSKFEPKCGRQASHAYAHLTNS